MKKKIALVLSIIMMVSAAASCAQSGSKATTTTKENAATSSAASEGVTLSLYGNADDLAKPYMTKIISMYEEASGNTIDMQGLDTENAETIALTKFTTGDIPDLYIHFGNSNLRNFNCEENFYDFSNAEWISDIQSNVLPQTKLDGKVYGLPFWEASVSGCFYNKQIFEDNNLAVPTSQAEFDTLCDKLVELGIQPIYLAAADSWPILYQFALDPVFDSEEGSVLIQKLNNNEITYADIPQFKDMLTWFKKAADNGWLGDTFMTDTWDYTSEVLGTGEAAMMFCWDTWFDTDYDSESYTYVSDDFGLMPFFMGTSDQGTFEGPNVNLMMVNKNGENAEIALEFVNFMADPANYNVAFDGVATLPVFKGQTTNIPSSQYTEVKDLVAKVGHASVAQPQIIGYSQTEGGKAIQELLTGNITIEECIKIMDDDRISTLKSFYK